MKARIIEQYQPAHLNGRWRARCSVVEDRVDSNGNPYVLQVGPVFYVNAGTKAGIAPAVRDHLTASAAVTAANVQPGAEKPNTLVEVP